MIKLFTDEFGPATGVAASFCTMERGAVTHQWVCRLDNHNVVYQAELYAVLKALDWNLENTTNLSVQIYSGSLSGL